MEHHGRRARRDACADVLSGAAHDGGCPLTPRNPRILIVDDDRVNRELVQAQLSTEGYEILVAHDGLTALTRVAYEAPDLVVCDVMMPGITGYEVVARLKADAKTAHVPVILLSSLGDASSRSHGLGAGAVEYIDKPASRHDLIASIRRLLRISGKL